MNGMISFDLNDDLPKIQASLNEWETDVMSGWFRIEYNSIPKMLICEAIALYGEGIMFRCGKAVIDTGADKTCISPRVVEQMKLVPSGVSGYSAVGTIGKAKLYGIFLALPGNILIPGVFAREIDLGRKDVDMLIGMDILSKGNLTIDNSTGKTILTFVMNTDHCDYTGFDPNGNYFIREFLYGTEYSTLIEKE